MKLKQLTNKTRNSKRKTKLFILILLIVLLLPLIFFSNELVISDLKKSEEKSLENNTIDQSEKIEEEKLENETSKESEKEPKDVKKEPAAVKPESAVKAEEPAPTPSAPVKPKPVEKPIEEEPVVADLPYKVYQGKNNPNFKFHYSKELPDATFTLPGPMFEHVLIGKIQIEHKVLGKGGESKTIEEYQLTNSSGYIVYVRVWETVYEPIQTRISAGSRDGNIYMFAPITKAEIEIYKGYFNFIIQSMTY